MSSNIEKVKTLISDMSAGDKKVKKAIEDLTGAVQKDKDEIISLLKEKRPELYSNWILEIASSYM